MKINVFKTQCKIGSSVKYKQKTRKVVDINRSTNEVCLDRRLWVRCTEVELLTSEKYMLMQKDWKLEEIKRLEKERDRNLAIHCNYVAAKHQRLIDRLEKEINQNTKH